MIINVAETREVGLSGVLVNIDRAKSIQRIYLFVSITVHHTFYRGVYIIT